MRLTDSDKKAIKETFFEIFEDGKITKLFQNSVKKGALQNGISKDDIENELEKFLKDFKEYLNKE